MKILTIIPPYIPSYFNAGHHLPVFSVAAYLRQNIPGAKVTCYDCAALNTTWKEICDLLIQDFDFIAVMNDFDAVDTFHRFLAYCREFSPGAHLLTFGRLSQQVPSFFRQFGFDAIISSGDYEAGVFQAIHFLSGNQEVHPGFQVRREHTYQLPTAAGVYLEATDWVLPNIDEIPFPAYQSLYKNDLNKFCGIPDRFELVVPIARGCPVGCSFCDVPFMQGRTERRISVERTLDYVEDAFDRYPMEYYSFYCPTFTLNKKWVVDFCSQAIKRKIAFPWKCVTVAGLLTEELIQLMALAGNIRISIGLETLSPQAGKDLPKIKQDPEDQFRQVAQWCESAGVELNCFIILGLPGDSEAGVQYTVEKVLETGCRVRPTIYTPYELMYEHMSVEEAGKFNRQFLHGNASPSEKKAYYDLFYGNKRDAATKVMENIPRR